MTSLYVKFISTYLLNLLQNIRFSIDLHNRKIMNIAIIGCGYVGSAVARHWKEKSYTITATTTSEQRVADLEKIANHVVVIRGDDELGLRSLLQNQDAVILSVAPKRNHQIDANPYEQTYLRTAQTIVAALQHTPRVKQLIYTGSYSVYGDRNGELVDEQSPVKPANSNGQILFNTEQVLLQANTQNLKVSILRLGGIYGSGRELVKIFSPWAGTTRPGKGEYVTNWIHLDDIVSAIDFALTHQLQGIYNVVNDVPMLGRELIDWVLESHNLPKVTWDESADEIRPYNARVSNQKIKAAGYKLIHPQIK
jgi:nucleoside-diphosphate-sugar epimerase